MCSGIAAGTGAAGLEHVRARPPDVILLDLRLPDQSGLEVLLARVLESTRGNLQQAALLLGIARQTLRLKLRDLGLSVTRLVEGEEDEPV
jgi:DNA-binding NtrC family response regulator